MGFHGLVAVAVVLAAFAFVPAASAHDCGGLDCGPCVEGENHNHGGSAGGCSTRKAVPGLEALAVGLTVLGVAFAARRPRA